jgi:hypothetical protein
MIPSSKRAMSTLGRQQALSRVRAMSASATKVDLQNRKLTHRANFFIATAKSVTQSKIEPVSTPLLRKTGIS